MDSAIKFAVWLPVFGWNGKYRQEGNGGWAGTIPYQAMMDPLRRGYVTAATDNGHEGSGANWAVGHPEKLIDFGHRAVHEVAVHAKAITRAFYGKEPSLSYFVGCSNGGREALMEAQRYPLDFDGMIAGAPANRWSHLFTAFVWNELAQSKTLESRIPAAKLPALQSAVQAACDQLDGVKDGLLEDPRACKFDPAALTYRRRHYDVLHRSASRGAEEDLWWTKEPTHGRANLSWVPARHGGCELAKLDLS